MTVSDLHLGGGIDVIPRDRERKPSRPFVDRIPRGLRETLIEVGRMSVLFVDTLKAAVRRPFEFRAIVEQIEQMGVRSLSIACVTAVFTGMVMTVQLAFGLERFGARDYVGRVIGVSITRELAPVLTALVVGCRIGSGMTAEIGSMAVTEQIDAIRALGADPVKKLVVPRVIACVLLLPVLAALADVVGFFGAMVVSRTQFGTPMAFFFRSALDSVEMEDLMSGLGKMPFFGVIIAIIGCSHGLATRGGTQGVGTATTRTVVVTAVSVLLADFFLTKVFIGLSVTG